MKIGILNFNCPKCGEPVEVYSDIRLDCSTGKCEKCQLKFNEEDVRKKFLDANLIEEVKWIGEDTQRERKIRNILYAIRNHRNIFQYI